MDQNKQPQEEVEEIHSDFHGFLEVRKKNMASIYTWKKHFFVVVGGTFFEFESSTSSKPLEEFPLKDAKLKEDTEYASRRYTFSLEFPEKEFSLSATTEEEKKLWLAQLKEGVDKPIGSWISRRNTKKGLVFRATNTVTGKMATSFAGRKLIREFVPDIVLNTLDSLKRFVRLIDGEEKAENFEKNILRLSTKVALLFKNSKLHHDDVKILHQPLNKVYTLIIDGHEGLPSFKIENLFDTLSTVKVLLFKLLTPHFKPKSVNRLTSVFDYVSMENMKRFFTEENKENATKVYETIVSMYY